MHKVLAIPAIAAALLATSAQAIDQTQVGREPTTNEVMADALVARPLGLVGTALGALTWVVALPFTLPSHTLDRATETLVMKPARYTFLRPIGQMDGCDALPQTCKGKSKTDGQAPQSAVQSEQAVSGHAAESAPPSLRLGAADVNKHGRE
jgi:hypothetical protein